ncbi:hypothetical protein BT69DRAFT_37029 [Atractiella rhizophila]|nr:hypothetical protein BT69DRAFT_37029 [Atractiella rhizophila]
MSTTPATSNEEGETFLSAFHHRRDSQSSARRSSFGASGISLPGSIRSTRSKTLPRTLSGEWETPTDSPISTPTLTDHDAETQPLLGGGGGGTIKKLTDPGGPLSLSKGKRNIILFAVWGGFFAAFIFMAPSKVPFLPKFCGPTACRLETV